MKEAEKIVNIDALGEDWLNNAFDSFEAIKKSVTYLNESNSFNLYDNDEDLEIDKLNMKQAIKETVVVLPLTYTMEKFLKAVILYYDASNKQNRTTAVKDILNNVKMSSNIKGNFHNILLLTDYINTHIDTHFMNFLASVYVSRRKGYNGETSRSNPFSREMGSHERIAYATDSFKNAFIDFRYLYEKNDKMESVDLVKLIDYVASIRDVAFYLTKRKYALDFFAQYDEFNKICVDPDKKFARNREYDDNDGVDLLLSIDNSVSLYAPRLFKAMEIDYESEVAEKFWDNKRTLCQKIKEPIKKLKNEYKPEFTKVSTSNFRNH